VTDFSLICIGAHTGFWIENLVKEHFKKEILLVEPVDYNFSQLKKRYAHIPNIYLENCAVSNKDEKLNFYNIKEDSIFKLKKHWASGIGSFNKDHILSHRTKRFKVQEEDIEEKKINCLSFMNLAKKFSIKSVDLLLIDVEGSEFKILTSIDYKQILIKKIIFEKKHFDGVFLEGKKFNELKELLVSNKYEVSDLDKENCSAIKKL
jgi:FkbM family methyltransferase